MTGNSKYIVYSQKGGGGGPVIVLNRDDPKRLPARLPRLEVHRRRVLDFRFNPFNDSLLATASEDCMVKVSQIPDGGLVESHRTALVTCKGHGKKVIGLEWNPTANNILATAGFDKTLKVWDVETGSACCDIKKVHGETLQHVAWNRNGSQIATTCKDKKFRLFDPRNAAEEGAIAEVNAFAGGKKSSIVYISAHELVCTLGFTRSSMRQIKLYDPRKLGKDLWTMDIDNAAGVLVPYYDHDTSILYAGGKGDCTIKYWEVVKTSPYLHFLSAFQDNVSQKGLGFLPKPVLDTNRCEIAQALRVMRDHIEPVHFLVPRKSGADIFQEDLYPDTQIGVPGCSAAEWKSGTDGKVVTGSMDPELRTDVAQQEVVVKKTYEELEAALATAEARIKELEAQLGEKSSE